MQCWYVHRRLYLHLCGILLNLTSLSTDVRTTKNETILHKACVGGNKKLVQYLVKELKCDIGEFAGFYITDGYLLLCVGGNKSLKNKSV